jgi:hypothetical protein
VTRKSPKDRKTSRANPSQQARHSKGNSRKQSFTIGDPTDVVPGRWLLKAILITVGGAAICAYLAICTFFYFGQWQLAFQPPKPLQNAALPTNAGMTIEDIHFDYTETGKAQLDGWWIPADAGAQYAHAVVLVCHSGNTSLTENLPLLESLHALGVGVFAFDYRGFGHSMAMHPSEQSSYADGMAAASYLTGTRHADAHGIVVYGDGIGAAVAVHIAQQAPGEFGAIAGVVLRDALPSLLPELEAEPRVNFLPVRLLFHDRFDILSALQNLHTPKLFLLDDDGSAAQAASALYQQAVQPKQLARLGVAGGPETSQAIGDFLQQVLR